MRLRRDARAVLLQGWGQDWFVVLMLIGLFTVVGPRIDIVLLAVAVGWFPLWIHGRTVRLEDDELLRGLRVRPRRVRRADIQGVRLDEVAWLRRVRMTAVVLDLVDGEVCEIDESISLGERRRRAWIEALDEWIAGSGPAERGHPGR